GGRTGGDSGKDGGSPQGTRYMISSLQNEVPPRSAIAKQERAPRGWILTTVGKACSIRNDLRLPISENERSKNSGIFPYYGPTGILDYLSGYRLDGTYALIGED